MVDVSPETIDEVAARLDELITAWGSDNRLLSGTPLHGSPIIQYGDLMAEKMGPAGKWSGESARIAGQSAVALLHASQEYLRGIRTLVGTNAHDFALAPVAGAMLEAVGRACWLLDPTSSLRNRAARVKLIWLDDHYQARSLRWNGAEKRQLDAAISRAREQIVGMFRIDEIVQPKKLDHHSHTPLPIACGETMPSLRASVRFAEGSRKASTPNLGGFYDTLSTLSHPTLAPIVQQITGAGASAETYTTTIVSESMRFFYGGWDLVARYHGQSAPSEHAIA